MNQICSVSSHFSYNIAIFSYPLVKIKGWDPFVNSSIIVRAFGYILPPLAYAPSTGCAVDPCTTSCLETVEMISFPPQKYIFLLFGSPVSKVNAEKLSPACIERIFFRMLYNFVICFGRVITNYPYLTHESVHKSSIWPLALFPNPKTFPFSSLTMVCLWPQMICFT